MEANHEHLAADEIGALLSPEGDPGVFQRRAGHLERCEVCRETLATHRREQSRLLGLSDNRRMEAGRGCASPSEWADVAAGLTPPERREVLLQHAAGCDRCGAMLRAVVEDFSTPPGKAEEERIEALKTSSPMWQREFARRMAAGSWRQRESEEDPAAGSRRPGEFAGGEVVGSEKPGEIAGGEVVGWGRPDEVDADVAAGSRRSGEVAGGEVVGTGRRDEVAGGTAAGSRKPLEFERGRGVGSRRPFTFSWLARAAAILLCAGASWTGYSVWSARVPERLLARAYAEQRPFALRIPGAEQAPLGAQQRGTGSAFQRPQPLMEAEVRIARELAKDPESRKWLGLRARAEMLGRDPESAIATLNRAMEIRPDDPELLADLGMAYALRAESRNPAIDYARANENLSRALKLRPEMREATFNRALVYERLFLYDEAIREWQRYLTLDGTGAWADEARRRLGEIESKKNSAGKNWTELTVTLEL